MKSSKQNRSRGSRSQKGASASDALAVLEKQHREVEQLLSRFEDASSNDEARAIASELCEKLTVHAKIEEEIFYPAAKEDEEDIVLEATEEHLSVKRIVADLEEIDAEDERLRPKMSVLKDQVSHHVDEEEHELFPKLRKEMSQEQRDELGRQLEERAQQLESTASNGTSGFPMSHPAWPTKGGAKGSAKGGATPHERGHSGRRGH